MTITQMGYNTTANINSIKLECESLFSFLRDNKNELMETYPINSGWNTLVPESENYYEICLYSTDVINERFSLKINDSVEYVEWTDEITFKMNMFSYKETTKVLEQLEELVSKIKNSVKNNNVVKRRKLKIFEMK